MTSTGSFRSGGVEKARPACSRLSLRSAIATPAIVLREYVERTGIDAAWRRQIR
jgi:hypothetical protein